MADINTLKATYFKGTGAAVPEGKLYVVDSTGDATPVELGNIPPYALPATLGTAGQVLTVNSEGDGLEWADIPD